MHCVPQVVRSSCRRLALAATIASLLTVTGCNRKARVVMKDQTVHRVELTHSTEDQVYGIDDAGNVEKMPRAEIVDVAHPGNVGTVGLAIPGALMLVLGGTLIWAATDVEGEYEELGEVFLTLFGVPVLGGGIALCGGAIWYSIQNSRSREALVPGGAGADVTLAPVIAEDPDGNLIGGAGVVGVW